MATSRKRICSVFLASTLIGVSILTITCFLPGQALGNNAAPDPSEIDIKPMKGSEENSASEGEPFSMKIILSEGHSRPQELTPLPAATGEPLSSQEIDAVLSRLPTLPPFETDQTDFKLPEESLPPPRPGVTIDESFPPLQVSPVPGIVESAPLEVLRYAPEGEVAIAPFISITFNQPMVPLTTLENLSAADVPVKIEPDLSGTWRWLGTKTLTFEYDSELIDRLPKATEFRVTVPQGTKSATGQELARAVSWTFTTPPPKITNIWPSAGTSQPIQPLMFAAFDQRISPAAVLEKISVRVSNPDSKNSNGSASSTLLLATEAEIKQDEQISGLIENTPEGRWLAFRAAEPFPAAADITITIGPGTPSAEGPLLSADIQTFQFSTFAPLEITEYYCYWNAENCPPFSPLTIEFNNELDAAAFNKEQLTFQPEIPGLTANVYGSTIYLQGQTSGRTTYTVTLSGSLRDIFGQTLGQDTELTFKIGPAEKNLIGPDNNFITLDPASTRPLFSFHAINYDQLDLKIYSVEPSDWPDFKEYLRNWQQTDVFAQMPGTLVADRRLKLDLPEDTLSQVDIDLKEFMNGPYGHFVVIVQPPKPLFETNDSRWQRYYQTILTWVQITEIGLDAFADYSSMLAWATDLRDGSPLEGVSIQPDTGGTAVITGPDGLARFEIPSGATSLIASSGSDRALLPRSLYYWDEDAYAWQSFPPADELRWYVFDDRNLYRPGEEVHLKGWIRRIGGGQDGDVEPPGNALHAVSYTVTDIQGNEISQGRADVHGLGGFDFVFTLPENVNLGTATVTLTAEELPSAEITGYTYYHLFEIQEFRQPEFEVTVRNETANPFFIGTQAVLAVEASYYAGGPLPNADVIWKVTSNPTNYTPPNWPDFTFGTWKPWWVYVYDYGYNTSGDYDDGSGQTFTGKTDAEGIHSLALDLIAEGDPAVDPGPLSVSAESTVMDVNRQTWTDSTAFIVHPADVYVGLRSDRYFVGLNTPLKIDFIVTDLDGNAVPDRPLEITAARLEWTTKDGNWVEEPVDPQVCPMTSGEEPEECVFETPIGGTYQITAIVTDELGRKNQSRITRWVSGGGLAPSQKLEQEKVTLIPDQETYAPGDTASILVQSPFSPAEGLLTINRSGILSTKEFHMDSDSTTLEVPILEEHIPNLDIQVDLAGAAARMSDDGITPLSDTPDRPAYASGTLSLNIPPVSRKLSILLTPDETELEPGGETTLTVLVKDANGDPVPDAELAVAVVNEAILALTGFQLPDPIQIFYSYRYPSFSSVYGRASVLLSDPLSLAREGLQKSLERMIGGRGGGAEATMMPMYAAESLMKDAAATEQTAINVRSDFNPLAAFVPAARTGLDGTARIPIQLPDNLTRYRIMVVAVDPGWNKFGMGESSLIARLPLMVRPSAPRFLNFGDRIELPVVIQNQTGEPLQVKVAARAANLDLTNAGLQVSVPAHDRVEVRIRASTITAGTARIQFAAVSGFYSDAAVVELPVYTPATTESFATYGMLDAGSAAQPVQYPTGVFPQFGGLEVTTSSTALQALTDAVLYLVNYPYECSEQLASRILAISALKDVLSAFKAEGLPSPEALQEAVARDIDRLAGMQNTDGGFPTWRRGLDSNPFNTIHTAHALQRAVEKGFTIPPDMQQNVLAYLRQIESYYPDWYSLRTRQTLSAYALFVRNLMGDRDAAGAEALFAKAGPDGLPMQAVGWLWPVIDSPAVLEEIRVYVNNHVVETAGAANFVTDYDDQSYLLLSSDRRTDAILLDALIEDDPASDLIPKLVNGLLGARTRGRWGSTQENVFALLALDRYFNTYEAETPDFVARLWLGDIYAGSSEFQGRTTELHETQLPMAYVLSQTAGGQENLILSKEGSGRLYYRLGLRYAPTDLNLDALDMGFVVQRTYEAVDDPADVTRNAEGVWHVRAGARIRVLISMVADNRRYHVALIDPLPAGLEIINPALAVSETLPENPANLAGGNQLSRYGWWQQPWYEHQNMRDDRIEAFASLLQDGVYEYSYFARATTPGTFIVPPAKAEEMYSPEVFGCSASDRVIVE